MNWFFECRTFEQGRAKYRKLAQAHHPDRGGDLRTMQEINSQWARFKKSNRPSPGAKTWTDPNGSRRPEPSAAEERASYEQAARETAQREARQRQERTRYHRASKTVRMPETNRRSFTRTVKLQEVRYPCKTCGTTIQFWHYPGSWKPEYCDQCRAEAKRAATRERQRRYRAAHKK